MNNAIYSDYLFCCIISQEKNKKEKTKMKKYILGYKCFSLHMYMIILYYIRVFDDMSRNISEYVRLKHMAFYLLVVVIEIKMIL